MEAEQYRHDLIRMATAMLGEAQEAAGIVNDVIAAVLLSKQDGVAATMRTKLYRTLRHRCANALRDRASRQRMFTALEESHNEIPTTETLDPYQASDDARSIEKAISLLPADEQLCVRGWYWEGKSYRQLAKELGISHTLVATKLKAARASMRGFLEDTR